jgi:hypothetical protein
MMVTTVPAALAEIVDALDDAGLDAHDENGEIIVEFDGVTVRLVAI